jgi:hypothetical protein
MQLQAQAARGQAMETRRLALQDMVDAVTEAVVAGAAMKVWRHLSPMTNLRRNFLTMARWGPPNGFSKVPKRK